MQSAEAVVSTAKIRRAGPGSRILLSHMPLESGLADTLSTAQPEDAACASDTL